MVSGVETVGRVREKEREIFAFVTGLVSVEILHPNQFLHSLRGRCKKGRGGEKKWGEVFLLVLLSSKSSSFFLSSTTPFDVCYAGVIYSTLAAKITNRDIMSFGAV